MKSLVVFISFWLLSFQFLSAQNSGEILARIIDTETSEPISFATVRLKNSNQGVIANYNGEFRIPLQFKNSIIVITSIGYEAKEIPLIELNQENLNIIKLKTQIEVLDPVFISVKNKVKSIEVNPEEIIKKNRKLSAKEIVLKAIREIPKNLSDKPHSYIGYYRDYQLINNKFVNLNEGILETFDKGINSSFLESDDVSSAVYSFSQNQNFTIDPSLTKAYDGVNKYIKHSQILPRGGNEYTILNIHNPIRNYNINSFSYVYRMDTDFIQLHKFSKGKIIFLNNEPLILI